MDKFEIINNKLTNLFNYVNTLYKMITDVTKNFIFNPSENIVTVISNLFTINTNSQHINLGPLYDPTQAIMNIDTSNPTSMILYGTTQTPVTSQVLPPSSLFLTQNNNGEIYIMTNGTLKKLKTIPIQPVRNNQK